MTNDDSLCWLMSALVRRAHARRMNDGKAAARALATADLPIVSVFQDPRRESHDLIMRATGPAGHESEIAGGSTEDAWRG
jgi:hypothetical protein